MTAYRKIGILGGMGPEATAELYKRIIRLFQTRFNAMHDSDFPEIILINLPIPDIVSKAENNTKVRDMLCEAAKRLEAAGAGFIVMPCNTATNFIEDIQASSSIPVINLISETVKKVKGLARIGLLGTEMTIRSRIYKKYFQGEILTLDQQERRETTRVILNILRGSKHEKDRQKIWEQLEKLKRKGAQATILGCTELPLLFKGDAIDTLDVLAEASFRESVLYISRTKFIKQ